MIWFLYIAIYIMFPQGPVCTSRDYISAYVWPTGSLCRYIQRLANNGVCRYGDTPSQVHDIDVWTGDRPCVATHGRLHACIIHACMLFQNFTKC